MKKILALWAIPRSTSTAFATMMREREDFLVLDEPFGLYFHYSEERKSDRYPEAEMNSAYNFQPLFQNLINKAQSQSVFIKDMARFIYDRADETFLSHFNHTFLIRHPAKSLPSLFDRWPNFRLNEAGYVELYKLFEETKNFLGKIPPVIDSDDLVNKPESTIKAYCDAVGIPFMPQALKWSANISPEINQWEGGWHTEIQSSQGFKEQQKTDYSLIENNDFLKQVYEYCLPYYKKVYDYRIRID